VTGEPRQAWLRRRISVELDEFLTERRGALEGHSPELGTLVDVLERYVRGGKLLRPAFCYWGWRAAGGAPDESAVFRAGSALELLHASALVHDDVMDASDRRRGAPTAHRALASLHRSHGWRGSDERFGNGAAILLGDLCLAWSEDLLRSCGLPADAITRALRFFEVMRTEVIAGQYLDLAAQAAQTSSLARSFEVIELKSARYTVQRPLQLGAALAGGSQALLDTLAAYGQPVGAAFQLRDDLLGAFGDPETTGKPVGDDLREGKRTVLLVSAYELAGPAGVATLDRLIGDPALDQAGVALIQQVLRDCGADQRVEALIDERVRSGLEALHSMRLADPEVVDALVELTTAVAIRVV
jgi:geranylgeranyl diphosphate synthase type I